MVAGVSEGAAVGGERQEDSLAIPTPRNNWLYELEAPVKLLGPGLGRSPHPKKAVPWSKMQETWIPTLHCTPSRQNWRGSPPLGEQRQPRLLPLGTLALGQGLALGTPLAGRPWRTCSPPLRESQRSALGQSERSRAETGFQPGVSSFHCLPYSAQSAQSRSPHPEPHAPSVKLGAPCPHAGAGPLLWGLRSDCHLDPLTCARLGEARADFREAGSQGLGYGVFRSPGQGPCLLHQIQDLWSRFSSPWALNLTQGSPGLAGTSHIPPTAGQTPL